MEKSPNAFRTISEAATELDVPQHVLRFWETKFKQIKPMKRGGGRRFYRPQDVDLIKGIKYFLYKQGYTIKGVQKILAAKGVGYAANAWRENFDHAQIGLTQNINKESNLSNTPKVQQVERGSQQPTPSDFVNEKNPISYVAAIAETEEEIYKRAQKRFNMEKDAKIQHVLTELSEIKHLLKSTKQKSN